MRRTLVVEDELNQLTKAIIGAAIRVHKALGPGFVERIYERALMHELTKAGIPCVTQQPVVVTYDGAEVGMQRVDLMVDDRVIVEVKAVAELSTLHEAQMLSYLRAADKRVGLILNFAQPTLNIKRMVHRF